LYVTVLFGGVPGEKGMVESHCHSQMAGLAKGYRPTKEGEALDESFGPPAKAERLKKKGEGDKRSPQKKLNVNGRRQKKNKRGKH